MVEADASDGVEPAQIILERIVVAMPANYVEWSVRLPSCEELACELADDGVRCAAIIVFVKGSNRRLEVSHVCETKAANGSKFDVWRR